MNTGIKNRLCIEIHLHHKGTSYEIRSKSPTSMESSQDRNFIQLTGLTCFVITKASSTSKKLIVINPIVLFFVPDTQVFCQNLRIEISKISSKIVWLVKRYNNDNVDTCVRSLL